MYLLILAKMGWATFWVIFFKTHVVTLHVTCKLFNLFLSLQKVRMANEELRYLLSSKQGDQIGRIFAH
jgi:hypothetical protein